MAYDVDPRTFGFDPDRAEEEGWCIADADGNSDGTRWQIQRIDSPEDSEGRMKSDIFAGDDFAHRHVYSRYEAGCQNATAAIAFLKANEPRELEIVTGNAARLAEDDKAN